MINPKLESGRLLELLPGFDGTATGFDSAARILHPSRSNVPLKVRAFMDFLREKPGRRRRQSVPVGVLPGPGTTRLLYGGA